MEAETIPKGQRKVRKIVVYILLIFCATSFYLHKLIPEFSNEFVSSRQTYKEAKKKNSIALSKVKKLATGTNEYEQYINLNKKMKLKYQDFLKAKKEESIFGFQSLYHFLERFGLMLCIFIYALYNLVKSFLREKSNIGAKVIHSFIISVTFYYFFWIFQKFQDFSKATYILMTVFSAILITVGVWFTTKYNKDRISKLREQMFIIARLGIKNAKVEKKESLLKDLRKITYEK